MIQSFPSIEAPVLTSLDGLRCRDIGVVQVFYEVRAAVGLVALETQLTLLICTAPSAFRHLAVALTLINLATVPASAAHINNQPAHRIHSNNAWQSPICVKYVIWMRRGKKHNFSFILKYIFKIRTWSLSPAGNDTPVTLWIFTFVIKSKTINKTLFSVLSTSRVEGEGKDLLK